MLQCGRYADRRPLSGGGCPGSRRLGLHPYDLSYLYSFGTVYGKRGRLFPALWGEKQRPFKNKHLCILCNDCCGGSGRQPGGGGVYRSHYEPSVRTGRDLRDDAGISESDLFRYPGSFSV